MGVGMDPGPFVLISDRVASAMEINDGDEVEFEIIEIAHRFRHTVVVKPCPSMDALIHEALSIPGLAQSESVLIHGGTEMNFHNGKSMKLLPQRLFTGMREVRDQGTVTLL